MNKKILVVLEEIIDGIPSGVISVTENLIKGIYNNKNISILTNKSHWILKQNNNKSTYINKIKKDRINFYTYSELNFFLNKNFPKLFLKLILLPLKIIIFIFLVRHGYYYLKKNNIDLVINQNGGWPGGELNLAMSCASYLLNIKNILIIHNLSSYKKSFYSKYIYFRDRIYNKTCSKIITVSKTCKKNLQENTYLKNINVVKNGSQDFSKLKKLKIKKIKKKKFIIGYVGHIHERKGIETVLDSLKNSNKEIQFVIIGGGNKNYISKLKSRAIRKRVDTLFINLQKKTYNFYHKFNLFILPSKKFESFGLVVIEAMSCSRAIICSNFGGMKEIIVNKNNGLLFKKNDSNDLRDKIYFLKQNKKISKKLSKNARLSYQKLYTSDIMVKNYKKYF